MPKYLFLCRHAHTPEAQPHQPDADRQISAAGTQEAIAAGQFIKSFNRPIDLFWCSTALRARQTAQLIAGVLPFNLKELKSSQELYYPKAATLQRFVAALPEAAQTVLVVSHNPALSDLVSLLSNSNVYVPTAGCTLVVSEAPDWDALAWSPFKVKVNY